MRMSMIGAVLLIGCGGGASDAVDAAPAADANAPNALGLGVVERIDVPVNATLGEAYGRDLDGDSTVDNQLGNMYSALVQTGLAPQTDVSAAVDRGEILALFAGRQCEGGGGTCLSLFAGASPDPEPCTDPAQLATCRRHLQGTATFAVDPIVDTDPRVGGSIIGTTYLGSGELMLPVLLIGDQPTWVHLVNAQITVPGVFGTLGPILVAGAIPAAEVTDVLIPSIHAGVNAVIEHDCTGVDPNCGCVTDSDGLNLLGVFDTDANCAVPLAEFRANSIVVTLLRPDVDLDGDSVEDAMSFGEQLHVVAADFTLP